MTSPRAALDNVVWHALTGPHARFAERTDPGKDGGAARYDPEVSPFTGIADAAGADDWHALRELVGPGQPTFLFRSELHPPSGWEELDRLEGVQLVAYEPLDPAPEVTYRRLGAADVPEMTALVDRTRPGPWAARTIELGTYIGVHEPTTDGGFELIAMAGERMAIDGHTEISAVCTDERHRGRGLAGALVRVLAAQIQARDQIPFLHAAGENATAIRLYEGLGFKIRMKAAAVVLRAPA